LKILFNRGAIGCILTISSLIILTDTITVSAGEPSDLVLPDSVREVYYEYLEDLLYEFEDEEADHLIDFLESLRDVPVDINRATSGELSRLPFLTAEDIDSIISTRDEEGSFQSIHQIYSRVNIDSYKIDLLLNFIFIGVDVQSRQFLRPAVSVRSHFANEFHTRRGYREGQYVGSPLASTQRVLVGMGSSIRGGLLVAKSAGENSFTERYSGYLSFDMLKNRVNVIAGDYRLHIGQGMLLGSGFGIAKGGNPTRGVVHRSTGVRPVASRSEHHRFRGIAFSLGLSHTELSLFYSKTSRAATVLDDGTVRTLITYPVYRTVLDREKRGALTELMYGIHIRQSILQNAEVGITYYSLNYDRKFVPDIIERFSGKSNQHGGVDWSVRYRGLQLFGETASALPAENIAVLSGLLVPVSQGIEAAIIYRNFPASYISLYGFPFGERRGFAEDEHGVYLGVRFRPAPRHLIEGYFDLYNFSNNNRSPSLPVNGSDVSLRIEYPVASVTTLEARIRRRSRSIVITEKIRGIEERTLQDRLQSNYRIRIINNPYSMFRLRMHFEYVAVSYPHSGQTESGSYLGADIRWNPHRKLNLTARSVLYGTDSFDSRLYAAEYDMPGSVRTVLFNGQGGTLSFGIRYTMWDDVSITAKYNEQFRSDGVTMGSGMQEINGSTLGVLMLQIDARL